MDEIWPIVASTVRQEFADLQDVAEVTRVVMRLGLAVLLGGLIGYERERRDSAVHRGIAQPAAGAKPFAKADDARKGVDHGEPALARSRDEQAAIVGAKIERAIGLARGATAFRSPGKGRSGACNGRRRRSGDLMRHVPSRPFYPSSRRRCPRD